MIKLFHASGNVFHVSGKKLSAWVYWFMRGHSISMILSYDPKVLLPFNFSKFIIDMTWALYDTFNNLIKNTELWKFEK